MLKVSSLWNDWNHHVNQNVKTMHKCPIKNAKKPEVVDDAGEIRTGGNHNFTIINRNSWVVLNCGRLWQWRYMRTAGVLCLRA